MIKIIGLDFVLMCSVFNSYFKNFCFTMKKVLSPAFFIAFTSVLLPLFTLAQSPAFSLSNEQNKHFNPGGSALMMVDDVAFLKSRIGTATQMQVTKVEIGIRQEATGSAATGIVLYATHFNGQTATGTPIQVGSQTLAATSVSQTTIVTFGDGVNTLFNTDLDDFGANQDYKGFGIGVRIINNNTANGWRVAAGPDYSLNKFWLYGTNTWAGSGGYYYFADGASNSFYIKVYGRFINPNASLPVKLVDFSLKNNSAAGSELTWTTATEENTQNFEVETTQNGTDWQKIGVVNAIGNSTQTQHYDFLDEKSSVQTHYYRLKINDFDGTHEFSKVIAVSNKFKKTADEPYISPNPVQETLKLHFPQAENSSYTLRIFNANGTNILEQTVESTSTLYQIDVSDWAKGAYFYELKQLNNRTIFTDKFVIVD
jgi:hypothetical protein